MARPSGENEINIIYKCGHSVAWSRYGRYNELNTNEGKFMMDMINNGTYTIKLNISKEEMKQFMIKQ